MSKHLVSLFAAGILGGAISLVGNRWLSGDAVPAPVSERVETPNLPARSVSSPQINQLPDFADAAEKAIPAVVNITATTQVKARSAQEERYYRFFGMPSPSKSTGSGVVISNRGYIVTNNHVVNGATEVEVGLYDKRKFKAQIIGTDPSTDLAVLKIDAGDLKTIDMCNSDEARIGEWVLALGNPFELNFTVTAGIISAKARNINIINGQQTIESFIQTDAAVNPGNSGGALINARGELLGINTAIATHTGSYSGYSFAVPINLVKKVVQDLIEHGKVKRGYLGVMIQEMNDDLAKQLQLPAPDGVYVSNLVDGGAAQNAGMQPGDVIVGVNNLHIRSVSELQEKIGSRNPGDMVSVTVWRNGSKKDLSVRLKD